MVFVDSPEKSEGIFLEVGFAKALGKKIILLISEKISLPTLEALADEVIKFKDFNNLESNFKIKIR